MFIVKTEIYLKKKVNRVEFLMMIGDASYLNLSATYNTLKFQPYRQMFKVYFYLIHKNLLARCTNVLAIAISFHLSYKRKR